MSKFNSSLYFITDSTNYNEEEFLYRVERALMGGVTLLQLREKEKSTREYIDLAEKVHTITKKYNVPLIIDDRTDVALAVDAEGVHVGQSDMPVSTARKLMGERKIIGATAKTVPQALEAYGQSADYLGVGAIYPTTTKVKTILTSTDTLRDILLLKERTGHSTVAVTDDGSGNGKLLGICAVSAIMKADDPRKAVIELKAGAKEFGIC